MPSGMVKQYDLRRADAARFLCDLRSAAVAAGIESGSVSAGAGFFWSNRSHRTILLAARFPVALATALLILLALVFPYLVAPAGYVSTNRFAVQHMTAVAQTTETALPM